MKIIKCSVSYFCGAKWEIVNLEVIGTSKQQCIELVIAETSAIHLYRSGYYITADEYTVLSLNSSGIFFNRDWELFKLDPEKYIKFEWEEIALPMILFK